MCFSFIDDYDCIDNIYEGKYDKYDHYNPKGKWGYCDTYKELDIHLYGFVVSS